MKVLWCCLILVVSPLLLANTDYHQLFQQAQYNQLMQKIEQDSAAPADPEIMLLKVRTLILLNFREEANTLLNQLVIQYPQHSALLTQAALNKIALANSGNVFHSRRRATDGLELLQRAINLDNNNFQAKQALISFYQVAPAAVGGSKALATQLALELKQQNASQGTLALVGIAVNEGRLADGLVLLEQQLSAQPAQADLLMRKAALLTQQSAFFMAQKTYLQALPLVTDPIQKQNVHFQLGRLAVFTEQYQTEGIAALNAFLQVYQGSQHPRLARAKLRLAQLYMMQNERAAAEYWYQQIKALMLDEEDFIQAREQLAQQLK